MQTGLKKARLETGMTQEVMAKMLDVAVSTYNQYENGNRSIPNDIAEKMSEILGKPIDSIFLPKNFTVSKIKEA